MVKLILAAVWLGFNLRSLGLLITNKDSSVMLLDLRAFLGQRDLDIPQFLDKLAGDEELSSNFRRSLLLNAAGLLAELILYAVVAFNMQSWPAMIFGALVLASHIQSLMLVTILALTTQSKQWFLLTFKKLQIMIIPGLLLEILWLAFLVLVWSGFLSF